MKESNERVLCGSGWVGRIVCTSLTPPRRRSLNKMAGRRCLERPWLTSCVGSKDVCVGRGEHDGQWLSAPSRGGIWLEGPDRSRSVAQSPEDQAWQRQAESPVSVAELLFTVLPAALVRLGPWEEEDQP